MTDRQATADYIGTLTRHMVVLAKRYRLSDLSFVLAMAELQAIHDAAGESVSERVPAAVRPGRFR